MDILIPTALLGMLTIAGFHLTMWVREKYSPTSSHMRSAGLMLVCLTALVYVMFGARLFLKPEVRITYSDKQFDLYANVSTNDKGLQIIETKKIVGCEVELVKSFPLMWKMGSDTKTMKYKTPCDMLLPEMKTEIANVTYYLKEEKP